MKDNCHWTRLTKEVSTWVCGICGVGNLGFGATVADKCPVCRAEVVATEGYTVRKHYIATKVEVEAKA